MKRKIALALILVCLLVMGAWLWWNRPPERVDMAGYVPADSLVFIEANSLPDIVAAIDSLDAWQALAPAAGLEADLSRVGTVSRLAAWTGLGPAEMIVFARSQVAVAMLGIDASESEGAVRIKPRAALVIETHTSEGRVRAVVERTIGDFARRSLDNPRVERRETEEAVWTMWIAGSGDRRIVAAVSDSVAVIGNDETTVEACLAARRGDRPTLAGNAELNSMRERLEAESSLAFGHIPAASAARLLELAATVYAGQISENPRVQSAAATYLPQLAARIVGGAGWSARAREGRIEDRYFFALQNNLASRLETSLEPASEIRTGADQFLPRGTYQLTRYNYRDAETAWRGMNAALSSQLDTLSAAFIPRFLDAALQPYGIEDPRTFFRAAGPEITTARLDDAGESTILIASVRDETLLRAEVRRHLGAAARRVTVGGAEMLVSADEEKGAAAFVAGYLVMGASERAVRWCLETRAGTETIQTDPTFERAMRADLPVDRPSVVTYTSDRTDARAFIRGIVAILNKPDRTNDENFLRALDERAYSVSATRLVAGGFQKHTRSAFGQFGALVTALASSASE